ncbi:hypothetical protein FHS90_000748 [Rufibacter quisquiliarum]|uniref:Uncharacterized protein n=1 Tax=Rufibacter quisquiliarum TaxID=1549639 RepID=A0A839GM46_9BACT|nr:hypothetical protein [Rufibacter quisquiliarum]
MNNGAKIRKPPVSDGLFLPVFLKRCGYLSSSLPCFRLTKATMTHTGPSPSRKPWKNTWNLEVSRFPRNGTSKKTVATPMAVQIIPARKRRGLFMFQRMLGGV